MWVGSNDLTGEQGDDRMTSIIDANTGSKKNDHDGTPAWPDAGPSRT